MAKKKDRKKTSGLEADTVKKGKRKVWYSLNPTQRKIAMMKKLTAQKQITVLISDTSQEEPVTCAINGVSIHVERGVPTKVPESIADMLALGGYLDGTAGLQYTQKARRKRGLMDVGGKLQR